MLARPALPTEISQLCALVGGGIDAPIAPEPVVAALSARDPESLWAFERDGRLIGAFALLKLNAIGVARLVAGHMTMGNPATETLAEPGEAPAGVYFWALLARGRARLGVSRVLRWLQEPQLRRADLWATPVTPDGQRFVDNLGFLPVAGTAVPGLCRNTRHLNLKRTA
ncbi:MAG: hypothetical protein KIS96_06990 [Bauldia sp.]|nr:hypothetical protein [Bauldia sp.]